MNKKFIYSLCAAAFLMTGCDYNEDNFPGYDEGGRPTDVAKIVYTLTDADYDAMGKDVKKNKYFSADAMPDDYIPDWLAKTYLGADLNSSAKITYRFKTVYPKYNDIPYLQLTEEDYTIIHGEGYYGAYLNEDTESKMYKILNEKYADTEDGAFSFIEYQYNKDAKPEKVETPIAKYDFEDLTKGDLEKISGWYISAKGNKWTVGEYSKNKYLQFTANKADGPAEAWLVTPAIKVEGADKKFAWDVKVGYWKHDGLQVLISTDFDGKDVTKATWDDVTSKFTIPQEPAKNWGDFGQAGIMNLDDYADKTIHIAFHYTGDPEEGKTTSYQIDNIVVGKDIPTVVNTELRFALYERKKNKWELFKNSAEAQFIALDDYTSMGTDDGQPGKDYSFSSTVKAENYIPRYLTNADELLYPIGGDTCTVIYRYYAGSGKYQANADQYIYNDTVNVWQYCDNIVIETRPYAYNGTEWLYSPSILINLPVEKNNAEVSAFYQAITDWVKENHSEYVTSYGNNDYYYGGSAYQNNFDFRVSAWQGQGTYDGMSSDEITALMWERLPEAFPHALEVLYADAAPADNGVDVIYTINFGIYDGSSTTTYTIQYKVIGKGKFEYVEDSLQKAAV